MNESFFIEGCNFEFRIKKLNAIEVLALKSQFSFKDYDNSVKSISLMLENLEVNVGNDWITVKDGDVILPDGLEENVEMIENLTAMFMEKFQKVFQKSDASKD